MVAVALTLLLSLVRLCTTVLCYSNSIHGRHIAFLSSTRHAANSVSSVTNTLRGQVKGISAHEEEKEENVESFAPEVPQGSPGFDLNKLAEEFSYDSNASMQNHMKKRLAKLRFIENDMVADPYPEISSAEAFDAISEIIGKHGNMNKGDEDTAASYKIYGRVVSVRFDGQFVVLQGPKGNRLQVLFKRKETINISGNQLKADSINHAIDIGDIIGVHGHIKKTSTGELTIVARSMSVLAKCLLPPPDPFHGLKDISTRFRLRHVDIMTNNDTRELLLQRSNMIWRLRQLLHDKGFIEVETPILNYGYSGANAKPFCTISNALGEKLYMRIAPEFFLKRLITGGLSDKIYEIGKCFRNEGTSVQHSPEFTMIEIYQQMADTGDMMKLTEDIIASLAEHLGSSKIGNSWTTKTMRELIKEHANVDVELVDREDLLKILDENGVDIQELRSATWGELVCELFQCNVQDKLLQPTHVTELPTDVAPLADGTGRYSRAFESYIGSMEIAHGCTEECNPMQLMRKLNASKHENDSETRDKEFMNSLAHGMPPTAGLGIGLDRLLMALTGASNIKSTQTFPLLRSV